jgi:PD-(D/E)XK endonuclease
VFVDNPNVKGNVAEAAIALAAAKCDLTVYKPVGEHGRTDLVLEIDRRLFRVQCKWGRLEREASVIAVGVESNRCTSNGYVRTRYERGEVELLGVYCAAVDRCYLLPQSLFVGKRAVQLRLEPAKNGQRSCINLAEDYEFDGAVAQLARAPEWHSGGRGFESPQLHSEPPMTIGSDEFRNRLGYYLDLAAEGQELFITRWGKRYLRMSLWQPQLGAAAAA